MPSLLILLKLIALSILKQIKYAGHVCMYAHNNNDWPASTFNVTWITCHRSWSDSEDSIVDVEADQQEVEDGGYEAAVAMFSKKGEKKKKPGRKTNWSAVVVNDLIDIVVNNDAYKRKLVFVNT